MRWGEGRAPGSPQNEVLKQASSCQAAGISTAALAACRTGHLFPQPRFPHPQGGTLVAAPIEGRARGAQGRALGDSAVTVGLPAADSQGSRRPASGRPGPQDGSPAESARCSGRRLRPGPCEARVPAT